MFNIRNKVYVSYPEDVHILSGKHRVIALTPGADPIIPELQADPDDPNQDGIVFQYNNYLEMLALQFDGSDEKFFKWLSKETQIWIAVGRDDDYARLFTMLLLEMKDRYKLSDEHVTELLNIQRLKNFFVGRPTEYDIADAFKLLSNGMYTPVGNLVDTPQDLSFEYVLYLYKHKYIDKSIADQKISKIAPSLLRGLIQSVTSRIRNDTATNRVVLREYFQDNSIDSIGEAMTAINSNKLIRALFFTPKLVDINDPNTFERVRKWTTLCVNNDVDYPDEHARHVYEHNMFYKLFETNDADLVLDNMIPFSQHAFITGAGQKFNTMLLTTLYTATDDDIGKVQYTKTDAGKWKWTLFNETNNKIVESKLFATKPDMLANLDEVKNLSQYADIIDITTV